MATEDVVILRRVVSSTTDLKSGPDILANAQLGFAKSDKTIVMRDDAGAFYDFIDKTQIETLISSSAVWERIGTTLRPKTTTDNVSTDGTGLFGALQISGTAIFGAGISVTGVITATGDISGGKITGSSGEITGDMLFGNDVDLGDGVGSLGRLLLNQRVISYTTAGKSSIYHTGSGGASYPFNNVGHLVIQSRGDNNRDIVFVTGATQAVVAVAKSNGDFEFMGNIVQEVNKYHYFGDSLTNDSVRMSNDSGDVVFESRISGTWTEIGRFTQ